VGKPGHVHTNLGDDDARRADPDARNLIQAGHRVSERGDLGLDPGVDLVDVGVDRIDALEHLGQQEPVVIGEVPDKRLF
jgi:hypothetical protein